MLTDWDYVNVRDFEYLNDMWEQDVSHIKPMYLHDEVSDLGEKLMQELRVPIAVDPLDPNQSKFFKLVYQNPSRNSNQQFIDPE
jgi:hypothetical protein